MADQSPRRSAVQNSLFSGIAARVQPWLQTYWRDVALGMEGGRDMGTFAGQSDPAGRRGSTAGWTPPRPENRTPSRQPAPDSTRKSDSLGAVVAAIPAVRDVTDFARAVTVGDSTRPPAKMVFQQAPGILAGKAINQDTGRVAANVTVSDRGAVIEYTDALGNPTGQVSFLGPGKGMIRPEWSNLDNVSHRYGMQYQAHSLDAPMMPLARFLAGMPAAFAGRSGDLPRGLSKGFDRVQDETYSLAAPSKDFAIQQAWARQAALQIRAQQLIDGGAYQPSGLRVPPGVALMPPPRPESPR